MGESNLLRTALSSLFGQKPSPKKLKLHVASEWDVLALSDSVLAVMDASVSAPGSITRLSEQRHIEETALTLQLNGKVGGQDMPPWADGSGGAPEFGVGLCRVKSAFYTPAFGAVITGDGVVLRSSVAEALYLTPDLTGLPSVELIDEVAVMQLPPSIRVVPAATIFMAWGGRFNYGHFLLDCLCALCVVAEQGLLERYPAVTPALTSWQKELLFLMLGLEADEISEVDADILKINDALFATPMDHFLHAPSAPLDKVRARILSRLPEQAAGPERLYLSRRKDEKRLMLNEIELEERLEALGFEIIHAQDLNVAAQISLFCNAKVVVGATGAAFANCLFCPPDTKVFEIQPVNYTGIWTRGLCHHVGLQWHGYFAPSPADDDQARLECERRPGIMFGWRAPIDSFMRFLIERL